MRKIIITMGLMALCLALSACNDSSTTNTGTTRTTDVVVESFANDSRAVLSDYTLAAALEPHCEPSEVFDAEIPEAYLVYRRSEPSPTRLVVFAHGIGHDAGESWVPHMRRQIFAAAGLQNQPGSVVFLSTNYRDNGGFPTLHGAHDTIAATLTVLQRFPTIETVYLMGVSMGGAVSGTAIAESIDLTSGGRFKDVKEPLFDYWLTVEGVSNIVETYAEAQAAFQAVNNGTAKQAIDGMERDNGGSPAECPFAYQRRSPMFHAATMKAGGLRAATVIHPVNDGLVPHNQGRQMASALTTALIPTQFYTVTRVHPWQDSGSTGTGTLQVGAVDPYLNLAGHASEKDPIHPVMVTAFQQLMKMLDGSYNETVPYFECIIDPEIPSDSCQVDQFQLPE
ncbi:hypothetical protein FHR99_002361 [Litorivivens lipolytica]|uniref:Alpha/beta hydrolase n=1 Tax=Litorivivens lipolytica TaxID=1524264 RepID=A0A7W4Z7J8_9GAMM|nr:hypothetical protein [Litorivivens lipolytica]MBB3048095.1 hypothetical protein [Litorivivens lipolytica]